MTKTRRHFTDEFRRGAVVKLVKPPSAMVTHIARDLGIEASVLRRWGNQEREGVLSGYALQSVHQSLPNQKRGLSGCARLPREALEPKEKTRQARLPPPKAVRRRLIGRTLPSGKPGDAHA